MLTDTQVRQARSKEKVYKLRDERGLLLMGRPKWWRLRYKVRDLTPDLRGLLEAPQVEHHTALTDPRAVGELPP